MKPRALHLIALATFAACGARASLPAARFANAPPVEAVDDREDVPARPDVRVFMHDTYHYDGTFQRRISRAMELPRDRRALGVNALDEVPDSTWFTNRIGVRDLTPDEVASGPAKVGSPESHLPFTIKSSKPGTAIGFIGTDARGVKFMLKFDNLGFPEQETGTHAIVDRLLWACGYNVTDDYVIYLRREDLRLGPGAKSVNMFGDESPLTEQEVDRLLARVEREADGRYRALASKWLDGKTIGGHPAEGVRDDDPNDLIPHQLRRDLRGAWPIFSWLDHVDVQEGNFMDVYVADAKDPRRHYVEHYLLDFGKSLGVMASTGYDPRHGHEYVVDFAEIGLSAITFGLLPRSWEGREEPPIRGVGLFDADSYDPGAWKPDSPAYLPFLASDRIDRFWGAKILARFTREQIHAAVAAARFSDPRATEYVTVTLVARQRKTAAYWFRQVNPLDRFTIDASPAGPSLCFDDLALAYALGPSPATTRYALQRYDFAGAAQDGTIVLTPDGRGHACSGPLSLAPGMDGYTIIRLDTQRADFAGTTYVHVARDPASGTPRVIGVWRP
jgi:hypothetical protein